MTKGEGNARNVPISLYPLPHIEVVNDAVKYRGFEGPSDYLQFLIEEDSKRNTKNTGHTILVYFLYPFMIIALILLYSKAIGSFELFAVGGFLTSLFFYSVYIGTLRIRGIDPRTHGKRRKKKKRPMETS